MTRPPLLEIDGYTLDYGTHRVLADLSLAIGAGEVVGLVGESGSGKSSLAWAIARDLPASAREVTGSVRFDGEDLRRATPDLLLRIRGAHIAMVFQDPATSLNPTLTLGRQITEVLRRHRGLRREEAWRESVGWLRHVELRDPEALMHRYPHEASGGEKQRVVIATAFACNPQLILFDEPTTALDAITGARILALFRRLRQETGVAALYISHDLSVVASVADRVAVLERGRIVEQAAAAAIFRAPGHPYTRRLVEAVPRPRRRMVDDAPAGPPLLATEALGVRYRRPRLFRRREVTGARNLTLDVRAGEILGVVGESGSGKSTLARALTGLAAFDGTIRFDGRLIDAARQMERSYRRGVQIVFQNPDASLNPRHRVAEILARPLRLFGGDAAVGDLLGQVRLPAEYVRRYPHQLSGGEKQRVAIARAFAARPALVICDEVTASLDVSVQAAVIELLLELRQRHGTAYLFITHDLNLVRQIAHRIAVMRAGELVDLVEMAALTAGDVHPYTRELMEATPQPVG